MRSATSKAQPGAVIAGVFGTIQERKKSMPKNSYVAGLLRAGTDGICCKLAEETGEAIKAAREESGERLASELCDVIFHAMILMAAKNIPLAAIEEELARRHGISGLDEKASRKKK